MSWFTENPWPLIVCLGLAAALCLTVWSQGRQKKWLVAASLALITAVVAYVISRNVETEGERVAKQIHGLADAFVKKDREGTLGFFSAQAKDLRARAEGALLLVSFPEGMDVKDISVEVTNQGSRAVSRFRANGNVSVTGFGSSRAASRWEVTWQKEAGEWKIVEVQRLHPYKEERMDFMDPRQN